MKETEIQNENVAKKYSNAIIIGADTIVTLEGSILGKPYTKAKAKEMLQKIAGKSHKVITGYTLIDTTTDNVATDSEESKVWIKKLTDKEIDAIFSPEKHLGASPAIISNVEKSVKKTVQKFI